MSAQSAWDDAVQAWADEHGGEAPYSLPLSCRCDDGRYRYICEAGHRTTTTEPRYDVCEAVLPYGGTVPGLPCGAEIEYRVVPYVGASREQ